MFAVVGLDGGNNQKDEVDKVDSTNNKRYQDHSDARYETRGGAYHRIQRHGYLEVQRLLAVFIYERMLVLLHLPDYQGRNYPGKNDRYYESGEPRQVTEHRPRPSVVVWLFIGFYHNPTP